MSAIGGTLTTTRQADEEEWVNGVGWTNVQVWEGPKNAIRGQAQSLALIGHYSRVQVSSNDNVLYRLRATVSGLDEGLIPDIIDQYELVGMELQEDLFNHPNSRALPESNIASIKKYLANPSLREASSPALTVPNAHLLWALVKNDQNSYDRGYYVLRHTRTVSNNAQLTASYSNVHRIHTRAQLPVVPASVNTSMDSIPNETAPEGYVFGWLKRLPSLSHSFNSRPQVIEEFWLYTWSTYVYGLAA